MIYLASPYTGTPAEQDFRYKETLKFTLSFLRAGMPIFSPIIYGRQFEAELGGTAADWKAFNEAILGRATQLWVLRLPGWQTSRGVLHELQLYQFLFPNAVRMVDPL